MTFSWSQQPNPQEFLYQSLNLSLHKDGSAGEFKNLLFQDVEGNVPSPHSTLVRDYSQQGSRWQRQVGVRL